MYSGVNLVLPSPTGETILVKDKSCNFLRSTVFFGRAEGYQMRYAAHSSITGRSTTLTARPLTTTSTARLYLIDEQHTLKYGS